MHSNSANVSASASYPQHPQQHPDSGGPGSSSLLFGPLPQSTYYSDQEGLPAHPLPPRDPQNPGTIRWSANGISTSAERRLPFVHRFRPVSTVSNTNGAPPPPSSGSGASHHHPYHPSGSGQHPRGYPYPSNQPQNHQVHRQSHPDIKAQKLAKTMAQYESNPIGALQEKFQPRGIIPEYKFLATDGASHCPVFTFQVEVAGFSAMGTGQTKKQAKQASARAILDILDGRAPAPADGQVMGVQAPQPAVVAATNGNGQEVKKEPEEDGENGSQGKKEGPGAGGSIGNKIGMLQEYCVTHGLPMPVYDLTNVGGQPHQRVFTMGVKIGSLSTVGEGTSKKEAKREAATKMWEKVQGLQGAPKCPAPGAPGVGVDNELMKMVADMKIETVTPKSSKAIQSFYSELNPSKGTCLYDLHRDPLSAKGDSAANYVKMLDDLGQEQRFPVTYVDVDDAAPDVGEVQCLVQISTMPVAVCYGLGKTMTIAKNEAARCALIYLKMMTKKNFSNANFNSNADKGQDKKKANKK